MNTTMTVRASARPVVAAAPSRPAFRAQRAVMRPSLFVRAGPPTTADKSAVETAIDNAKESCESGTTGECAAAWDEVEELSADVAHRKQAKVGNDDPLDAFCEDNPDADECRVYED